MVYHAYDTPMFATNGVSVMEAMNLFESYSKDSGTRLNMSKSKALALCGKIDKSKWPQWLK